MRMENFARKLTGGAGPVLAAASLLVLTVAASPTLASAQAPNTLTAAEKQAGWRLLWDGKTFDGWRGLGSQTVPTAH